MLSVPRNQPGDGRFCHSDVARNVDFALQRNGLRFQGFAVEEQSHRFWQNAQMDFVPIRVEKSLGDTPEEKRE